jgi:hypothetical protein
LRCHLFYLRTHRVGLRRSLVCPHRGEGAGLWCKCCAQKSARGRSAPGHPGGVRTEKWCAKIGYDRRDGDERIAAQVFDRGTARIHHPPVVGPEQALVLVERRCEERRVDTDSCCINPGIDSAKQLERARAHDFGALPRDYP